MIIIKVNNVSKIQISNLNHPGDLYIYSDGLELVWNEVDGLVFKFVFLNHDDQTFILEKKEQFRELNDMIGYLQTLEWVKENP